MFDWIGVEGALGFLMFLCTYGFYQIGKDFTMQMNNHDRICDDLDRIEKKIDSIENGLDLYSIEKKIDNIEDRLTGLRNK